MKKTTLLTAIILAASAFGAPVPSYRATTNIANRLIHDYDVTNLTHRFNKYLPLDGTGTLTNGLGIVSDDGKIGAVVSAESNSRSRHLHIRAQPLDATEISQKHEGIILLPNFTETAYWDHAWQFKEYGFYTGGYRQYKMNYNPIKIIDFYGSVPASDLFVLKMAGTPSTLYGDLILTNSSNRGYTSLAPNALTIQNRVNPATIKVTSGKDENGNEIVSFEPNHTNAMRSDLAPDGSPVVTTNMLNGIVDGKIDKPATSVPSGYSLVRGFNNLTEWVQLPATNIVGYLCYIRDVSSNAYRVVAMKNPENEIVAAIEQTPTHMPIITIDEERDARIAGDIAATNYTRFASLSATNYTRFASLSATNYTDNAVCGLVPTNDFVTATNYIHTAITNEAYIRHIADTNIQHKIIVLQDATNTLNRIAHTNALHIAVVSNMVVAVSNMVVTSYQTNLTFTAAENGKVLGVVNTNLEWVAAGEKSEVMRMDVSGNIPGFMFAAVALPKTYAEIEAATVSNVVAVNIHNSLDFPSGDREVTANVIYSTKGSVFVTDPSGASTEYPNALIFHSRSDTIKRSTDYYLAVLDIAGYGTAGFVIVKEENSVQKIKTPNNWDTGYLPEYGEESGSIYLPVVEYEQDDMTGQYSAVTVGTRTDGETKGEHSVTIGTDNKAGGSSTFVHGYASSANGNYSHAIGIRARSDQDYSFVWQGVNNDEEYASHDDGTFNVNPNGGTEGFYIGQTKLSTITNDLDTAIRADMQTNLVVGTGTANKFLKNDGSKMFWAEAGGGKKYLHKILLLSNYSKFIQVELITDSNAQMTTQNAIASTLYNQGHRNENSLKMATGFVDGTVVFGLFSTNGSSLSTRKSNGIEEGVWFYSHYDTVQEL